MIYIIMIMNIQNNLIEVKNLIEKDLCDYFEALLEDINNKTTFGRFIKKELIKYIKEKCFIKMYRNKYTINNNILESNWFFEGFLIKSILYTVEEYRNERLNKLLNF